MRVPDQILDRFYVINMAFLSSRSRHVSYETSLMSRSEERSLYLQATTCYNTFSNSLTHVLLELSVIHLRQSLPSCKIFTCTLTGNGSNNNNNDHNENDPHLYEKNRKKKKILRYYKATNN